MKRPKVQQKRELGQNGKYSLRENLTSLRKSDKYQV